MRTSSRKMIQSLLYFGGNKIYTDITEESNPKYIRLCDQSAIRLLKDISKTLCIISICVFLYAIFPLYTILDKHELQLPLPVFLPFTDTSTVHGIVINIINQIFISLLGLAGNFGIEIAMCMLKNTVWATAVAICFSIDEFTDSIIQSKPARDIDKEFRNILIQLQDYDRYVGGNFLYTKEK